MKTNVAMSLSLCLGAAASASCVWLVRFDDVQCTTAADCSARGGAFARAACVNNLCSRGVLADASGDAGDAGPEAAPSGAWACLELPPLPPSDPSLTVDVRITAFDVFQPWTFAGNVDGGNDLMLLEYSPEVGVATQACDTLDPLCGDPVADAAPTDDAGVTDLMLNGAFSGFYRMTRSDSLPTLFFPGRLLPDEPRVSYPTGTFRYAAATAIGSVLGITVTSDPDAGVGHVFVAAFDCTDHHVAGVVFSLMNVDAGTPFYLQNRLPSTKVSQTDLSGVGGWMNVPAGEVEISATFAADNRPLGTRNVILRPGGADVVLVRPRTR